MSRAWSISLTLAVALLLPACGPSAGDDTSGGDAGPVGPQRPDADKDGISDADEARGNNRDSDRDSMPDYLDTDSDNDTLLDAFEAGDTDTRTPPRDSDGDGKPDYLDDDSDGNGRADRLEGMADTDMDSQPDFADRDDDNDNLMDTLEIGPDTTLPNDSDGDATPDYKDTDSDNDSILDQNDGITDLDADSLPAFIDVDADGDCRPDSFEAGDSDPATRPIDTDRDTVPDFLDIDADNDGLLDRLEDRDCNGIVGAGESDPKLTDTDMDGVTDLVEIAAGTNPGDASSNPRTRGDFVFLEPYNKPADPARDTLDFSTTVTKADVFINMDVTGSMQGAINNVRNSIRDQIVPAIRSQIPNTGFGFGVYRDFNVPNYGQGGDQPFHLIHRIMTANTAAGLNSIVGATNDADVVARGGNDTPESGWEALYQIVEGTGISVGNASVPAFNPLSAPPSSAPAGEEINTTASGVGVGWRQGALPIVLMVTDAPSHEDYNFAGFHNRATTVGRLQARQIRVIGVYVDTFSDATAKAQLVALSSDTGARVPATAWDGARPTGCGAGQCCTGINGAGVAASGGMCNLTFDVAGNGTGLSTSIAKGIEVLTKSGTLDVEAIAEDDPSDAVNAVTSFIMQLVPAPNAPAPCTTGGPTARVMGNKFLDVSPGYKVCFDVVPKMNTTVMATTEPQLFKASIKVVGDGVTVLSTRSVFFLVPPEIPIPEID